jgi:hypothetical protein
MTLNGPEDPCHKFGLIERAQEQLKDEGILPLRA